MSAHTPGPWRVMPNPMRDDGWFVVRDRRADERQAYPGQLPPAIVGTQVPLADAHLIAAAPDLLAALKRSLDWLASYQGDGALNVLTQARDAIAKAEGR